MLACWIKKKLLHLVLRQVLCRMKFFLEDVLLRLTKIFCVFLFTMCIVAVAHAETVKKIGVLQNQKILERTEYGKEINKRLQKNANAKKEELSKKENLLNKKRDAFQRDEAVLSDKERTERKQELAKMQRDFQGMFEQYEMELQDMHQEEMQKLSKLVMVEVKKVANAEKMEIVLPDNLTLYYDSTVDVTDKIIKALDVHYKSSKG